MADVKSTNSQDASQKPEADPFARAVVYRLRRDALFIVSNLNRGIHVENDTVKRQLVFVQSQLCAALLADPRLTERVKTVVLKFHAATISENLEDRRGARRRRPSTTLRAAA
jgi:hypothetical protein